jgi:hypothetical protein
MNISIDPKTETLTIIGEIKVGVLDDVLAGLLHAGLIQPSWKIISKPKEKESEIYTYKISQ